MQLKISERLTNLPPYLFVEIDKLKRKAKAAGKDIIDLGIGDPDQGPPKFILDALCEAIKEQGIHRYALDQGYPDFREAIAAWYKERFAVVLDPATEILPLIGSKEGIAHLPMAFINRGDYTLTPDPCYPPYRGGTILAEGRPYSMPLLEANGFLPDFKMIPKDILKESKLMFFNYPNNPTSAVADEGFYTEAVKFAEKNSCLAVSDLAYSEMSFDGYKAGSFLQAQGAKDVGIEFHSLSKTYNMTGWRIGWACGNGQAISALAKVKSNIDSGIFTAIQKTGVAALEAGKEQCEKINKLYQERRDALVDGLNSIGWKAQKPKATFYIWSKAPKGYTSMQLSRKLLTEADIVVTPGEGFGEYGKGYVRMALTVSVERIKEAVNRIGKVLS